MKEASDRGVTFVERTVSKIVIMNDDYCKLDVDDGYSITTMETIVAGGAWTPILLRNSNMHIPTTHYPRASGRPFFTIAAVNVANLELNDSEYHTSKSMPILVTDKGLFFPFDRSFRI